MRTKNAQDRPAIGAKITELLLVAALVGVPLAAYSVYDWIQVSNEKRAAIALELAPPKYGQWTYSIVPEVVKTMGENGFSGHWAQCGVIKTAVDLVHKGKFIVRCSAIGKDWSEYVVDTNKRKVYGPRLPNPEYD